MCNRKQQCPSRISNIRYCNGYWEFLLIFLYQPQTRHLKVGAIMTNCTGCCWWWLGWQWYHSRQKWSRWCWWKRCFQLFLEDFSRIFRMKQPVSMDWSDIFHQTQLKMNRIRMWVILAEITVGRVVIMKMMRQWQMLMFRHICRDSQLVNGVPNHLAKGFTGVMNPTSRWPKQKRRCQRDRGWPISCRCTVVACQPRVIRERKCCTSTNTRMTVLQRFQFL